VQRRHLNVRVPLLLAALGMAALGMMVLSFAATSPAGAEPPSQVAEEVADDGVFVGFGRRDIDEEALIAAVEDARFDALRIVAVAPRDPQPGPAAYARRIQEETEADAALVFPMEGPVEVYVIEDLDANRVRAVEAARQADDPASAVAVFAREINSVRETGTPEIVGQIMRALVIMALVIGVVVTIEQAVEMFKRRRASV
jgi:hypothetical protein